jgi:hypothetical protein
MFRVVQHVHTYPRACVHGRRSQKHGVRQKSHISLSLLTPTTLKPVGKQLRVRSVLGSVAWQMQLTTQFLERGIHFRIQHRIISNKSICTAGRNPRLCRACAARASHVDTTVCCAERFLKPICWLDVVVHTMPATPNTVLCLSRVMWCTCFVRSFSTQP